MRIIQDGGIKKPTDLTKFKLLAREYRDMSMINLAN